MFTAWFPDAVVEPVAKQVTDVAAIAAVVQTVVARHQEAASAFRGGKTQVLGFLVGQALKALPEANPKLVSEALKAALAPVRVGLMTRIIRTKRAA